MSERRAISSNSGHDVTQPPSHVTDTSSHVISAHSSILEPRPPDQLEAVRQAFAGDDVVSEFVEEKEQLLQESRAKTVDLTMPGTSLTVAMVTLVERQGCLWTFIHNRIASGPS